MLRRAGQSLSSVYIESLMMSDSDSEYCDVGIDDFENINNIAGNQDNSRSKQNNYNGKRARGKDINWLTIKVFENVEDYENNDLFRKSK